MSSEGGRFIDLNALRQRNSGQADQLLSKSDLLTCDDCNPRKQLLFWSKITVLKTFLEKTAWLDTNKGELASVISEIIKQKDQIIFYLTDKFQQRAKEDGVGKEFGPSYYHVLFHLDVMSNMMDVVIEMFEEEITIFKLTLPYYIDKYSDLSNLLKLKGDFAERVEALRAIMGILIAAHDVFIDYSTKESDEQKSADYLWHMILEVINSLDTAEQIDSDLIDKLQWHFLTPILATALVAAKEDESQKPEVAQFNLIPLDQREEAKKDFVSAFLCFVDLGYFFADIDIILEFLIRVSLERKLFNNIFEFSFDENGYATDVRLLDLNRLRQYIMFESNFMNSIKPPEIFPDQIQNMLKDELFHNWTMRNKIFSMVFSYLESEETQKQVDSSDNEESGHKGEEYWTVLKKYALSLYNAHHDSSKDPDDIHLTIPKNLRTGVLSESYKVRRRPTRNQ